MTESIQTIQNTPSAATAEAKKPVTNYDLLMNAAASAYLAIVSAFCKTQAEAAKEDAEQTNQQIAEGQASAEVQATYAQIGASQHSANGASNGQEAGNGALTGGAASSVNS